MDINSQSPGEVTGVLLTHYFCKKAVFLLIILYTHRLYLSLVFHGSVSRVSPLGVLTREFLGLQSKAEGQTLLTPRRCSCARKQSL